MNKEKITEWVKRYGLAEVLSTALAWAGAKITYETTKDSSYAALTATWAGNLGYYGPIFIKDINDRYKSARKEGKVFGLRNLAQTLRNLAIEFGPSGTLDALVTRPLLTKFCIDKCGPDAGMFMGRYTADAIFYGLTIPIYEAVKKMKSNKSC